MGLFSLEKLFGMTIRESANDGSDFTNPDADYRRLFLGEDGLLHLKDSAGTVTDVGGGGGDVATDAIWDAAGDLAVGSGANTAARLAKGAAGANLSTYNGVVAWNGGTSFPASPATGDRYWRSDLGLECHYDGTRWLGPKMFLGIGGTDVVNNISGAQTPSRWTWNHDFSLYVMACHASSYVATTNTGAAYWTGTISKIAANNTPTSLGTFDTSADSVATWTAHKVTIGTVVTAAEAPGGINLAVTKTGAPGNIYVNTVLECHLVLT